MKEIAGDIYMNNGTHFSYNVAVSRPASAVELDQFCDYLKRTLTTLTAPAGELPEIRADHTRSATHSATRA